VTLAGFALGLGCGFGCHIALAEAGSFALQATQIIQLRAPYPTRPDNLNVIHHWSVQRENTLHTLAKTPEGVLSRLL
jgi:hypothetical protein